ncbi:amidohydrolase family protein [Glaciihabitans sp. UYNi722]|uniref:amidohydrolase family protein n=1 Tax=Glaciihabitans sp. UYNi722 TaxID=3156344 RepID=UPI003395EBD3
MIIDCHAHYTTAPASLAKFRQRQLSADGLVAEPLISDDELRESVETKQLAEMQLRGTDRVLFSPKASAMGHDASDPAAAAAWSRVNNDVIGRLAGLYPDQFVPVAQLPQTPSGSITECVSELRRVADGLGFVGCNLNPDPSGGLWTGPPMTDASWFPLYETLVELGIPAMIHVSTSAVDAVSTLGAHYLNADTTVFMQLVLGDVFEHFPDLRLVIPHGGGAVPYHWGRFRGLASRFGRPDPELLLRNVFFDTAVYHPEGVRLLVDTVGARNLLFASEMLGAIPGEREPESGELIDDTKRYIDRLGLSAEDASLIFEGNARRVYSRLR